MPLIKLTAEYAVVPNHILYNPDLSFRAKGLWVYLNSKPDGWDFSAKRISQDTKESEDTIHKYLTVLCSQGYLERKKLNSGKMDYVLTDNPFPDNANLGKTQVAKNLGISNTDLLNNTETEVRKEKIIKENAELKLLREKIIDHLNEKTSSKWKPHTADTKKKINARVSEGFTLNDFITCIDKKVDEWYGTEWGMYLRPSTLFSGNMERYVNTKTENDQFEEMVQKRYSSSATQQDFDFER